MDEINFIGYNQDNSKKKPSARKGNDGSVAWTKPPSSQPAVKPITSNNSKGPAPLIVGREKVQGQNWFKSVFGSKKNIDRPQAANIIEDTRKQITGNIKEEKPAETNNDHVEKDKEYFRKAMKEEIEKRINGKNDMTARDNAPKYKTKIILANQNNWMEKIFDFFRKMDLTRKTGAKIEPAHLDKISSNLKPRNPAAAVESAKRVEMTTPALVRRPPAAKKLSEMESPDWLSGRDLNEPVKRPGISMEKRKWESPKIIETNLLSGEINNYQFKNHINILILFLVLSIGLMGSLYWMETVWEKNKRAMADEYNLKLTKLNEAIKSAEKDTEEINKLKENLNPIRFIIDNHVYWTNMFEFLEKSLITNAYIPSFGGDLNGQYSLDITANDYKDMDAQIKFFRSNPLIKDVKLSGANMDYSPTGNKVHFRVSFNVDPGIFFNKEQNDK
jgi:hypothetical protein